LFLLVFLFVVVIEERGRNASTGDRQEPVRRREQTSCERRLAVDNLSAPRRQAVDGASSVIGWRVVSRGGCIFSAIAGEPSTRFRHVVHRPAGEGTNIDVQRRGGAAPSGSNG
jgi:hypothetical protein